MYKIQIQLNMIIHVCFSHFRAFHTEKIMDERAVDNVNSVYFNDT